MSQKICFFGMMMLILGCSYTGQVRAGDLDELAALPRITVRFDTAVEAAAAGAELYYQGGARVERSGLNTRYTYCKIVIGTKQPNGLARGTSVKLVTSRGKSLNDVSFAPQGGRPCAVRELSCVAPDYDPIGTIGISPETAQGEFGRAVRIIADGKTFGSNKIEEATGSKHVGGEAATRAGTAESGSKAQAK